MTRVVGWDEALGAPLGSAAVALGVFDGVHVGHQALLGQTAAAASASGVTAVALTFDRDPDQVVDPGNAAPQLLDLDDKLEFVCERGMDAVLLVPFTKDVADMPPRRFLEAVLTATMAPRAAFVGEDFRFGAGASGSVDTLAEYGRERDFEVYALPLTCRDGAPVTSTRIRAMVAAGEVARAAELLGREHRVSGKVVRGRGAGRSVSVPTANIQPRPYAALPADGVYAGWVETGGSVFPAAVSCGVAPSFIEADARLEAHLIGYEGDLYGERVRVSFVERLRELIAFGSPGELRETVLGDVERVRSVLGG